MASEVEQTEAPAAGNDISGVSATGTARQAELDDAQLLVGGRVGAYEITRFIARGGMGLVFAGRDVRLGRTVAIKVLPAAMTNELSLRARFVREAKILASLSHPNLAIVYGLEEEGDDMFLIMEFVEGNTLAARIASRALTVAEAIEIGVQIVSAVEEAHRAGVIHRDLKPGNVMISPAGRVKVLDFGLAREIPRDSLVNRGEALDRGIATITSGHVVMGTPGYMSPEQACGDRVDERTDVFAFGAILYECLTGRPAFHGKNVADVIAGVLSREPDWGALPEALPRPVRELLERCLAKDVGSRPRAMSELGSILEDARRLPTDSTIAIKVPTQPPKQQPRDSSTWSRVQVSMLALGVGVMASGLTYAVARRAASPLPPPPVAPPHVEAARPPLRRLSIPLPGDRPQRSPTKVHVSITRDGSRLVFTAARDDEPVQLWTRRLDQGDATPIADIVEPRAPAISPDGQWVAYVQNGMLLKRRVAGGEPLELAPQGFEGQAAWAKDGSIVMAPWTGLARLSAQGRTPDYILHPQQSKGEICYILPTFLPDNDGALYTVWSGHEDTRIDMLDFATRESRTLIENGANTRFANTARGPYLLWERRATIYAAPFDEKQHKLAGPEHAIVDGVLTDAENFDARFDVSDEGTLVYIPGKVYEEELRLVLMGPKGARRTLGDEVLPFAEPHFSADGKHLSVIVRSRVFRVNLYDLERNTSERLSLDVDISGGAISPDGYKLAYSASGNNGYELRIRNLRDGAEQTLDIAEHGYMHGFTWSPDGKYIAFSRDRQTDATPVLWFMQVEPTGNERKVSDGSHSATFPAFSPNAKWLAYAEGSERDRQVYIRSFPDGRLKRQITTSGGDQPNWAPDGKSLYYISGPKLYVVDVSPEDGKIIGMPRAGPDVLIPPYEGHRNYAVAPDGRLLIAEPAANRTKISSIHVILGWDRLLPD